MPIISEAQLISVERVLSCLEKLAVVFGAALAAVKLQAFGVFKQTHLGEMKCDHKIVSATDLVFSAEYSITNLGDLPIHVSCVSLCLCKAKEVEFTETSPPPSSAISKRTFPKPPSPIPKHLGPDRRELLAFPTVMAKNQKSAESICGVEGPFHFKPFDTLGYIRKDARSTFTLRCRMERQQLPGVVFVEGEFWTRYLLFWNKRKSFFSAMYIQDAEATTVSSSGAKTS